MKRFFFLSLFVISLQATAQPYLDSFDIRPGAPYAGSNPSGLHGDGNILYFVANDSAYGQELWVFFANTTFPQRITDIREGAKTSLVGGYYNTLTTMNGTVYFTATDSVHGYELWRFHGTTGYVMVDDIAPGALSSLPTFLLPMNGKLYFSANTKDYGTELWMYDPPTIKTKRLSDIRPDSLGSNPRELAAFNNKVCFQAFDSAAGIEFFEYDPADGSVKLVADIYPGKNGSNPSKFVAAGNKLYFVARDSAAGSELFEYDGSNPPKRITDLYPGIQSGVFLTSNIAVFNGKIYFYGYDAGSSSYQLMVYDPANSNASVVHVINSTTNAYVQNLCVFNNELFFSANDGVNGIELWKYDGSNTPVRITDIQPGLSSSNINGITATGLYLYFSARGAGIGNELYRYSNYPLGIQHVTFKGSVTVYPNPAKNTVHLKLQLEQSRALQVILTDMSGKIVYSSEKTLYSAAEHIIDIPVQHLATGNYMYRITGNDGRLLANGKVVKQ